MLHLVGIGIIQYGIMYTAYIASFQYLKAHEVAVFTLFTPFFVILIFDLFYDHIFRLKTFFLVVLAVIGGGVIIYKKVETPHFIWGLALVQISNICFALGQIHYRHISKCLINKKQFEIFGFLYLGAILFSGVAMSTTVSWNNLSLTMSQIIVLAYLGIVATGLASFLWNYGATKVSAGSLAVFNNAKIPLAVFVALTFFGESTDLIRLSLGGGLILISIFVIEKTKSA